MGSAYALDIGANATSTVNTDSTVLQKIYWFERYFKSY